MTTDDDLPDHPPPVPLRVIEADLADKLALALGEAAMKNRLPTDRIGVIAIRVVADFTRAALGNPALLGLTEALIRRARCPLPDHQVGIE